MEDDLDKIADGDLVWYETLDKFYKVLSIIGIIVIIYAFIRPYEALLPLFIPKYSIILLYLL